MEKPKKVDRKLRQWLWELMELLCPIQHCNLLVVLLQECVIPTIVQPELQHKNQA